MFKKLYISEALQALGLLVSLSLVFGFLITNIYLSQFGFSDFSFLRVNYITAGIGFLLFLGVSIFIEVAYYSELKRIRKNNGTALAVVAGIFGAIFVFLLIEFLFVVATQPEEFTTAPAGWVPELWTSLLALILCMTHVIKSRFERYHEPRREFDNMNTWMYALVAIALVIVLVSLYANIVYAKMPRYLGGGAAEPIAMSFHATVPMLGDATTTDATGLLIYQSPDVVLFKADDKVLSMQQADIESIQYLDDRSDVYLQILNSLDPGEPEIKF